MCILSDNKQRMYLLAVTGVYQVLGWIGTCAYLLAYFLLTINKLTARHIIYQVLNVIGAAGLIINAIYYADLPNVVVNMAWGIIALSALAVLFWKRRKQN